MRNMATNPLMQTIEALAKEKGINLPKNLLP